MRLVVWSRTSAHKLIAPGTDSQVVAGSPSLRYWTGVNGLVALLAVTPAIVNTVSAPQTAVVRLRSRVIMMVRVSSFFILLVPLGLCNKKQNPAEITRPGKCINHLEIQYFVKPVNPFYALFTNIGNSVALLEL
jgi:hypothetical protein